MLYNIPGLEQIDITGSSRGFRKKKVCRSKMLWEIGVCVSVHQKCFTLTLIKMLTNENYHFA